MSAVRKTEPALFLAVSTVRRLVTENSSQALEEPVFCSLEESHPHWGLLLFGDPEFQVPNRIL